MGSKNHHWRGGRTKHHAGYIMVRVPGHHRARTVGYVFEHILVMKELLGRQLFPDENVHHKNGVRNDNGRRTSNCGSSRIRPVSGSKMLWPGHARSFGDTREPGHLQQRFDLRRKRSWR